MRAFAVLNTRNIYIYRKKAEFFRVVSKKRKPAIFAGGLCALASLFVRHFKGKKRHTNLHAKSTS